MMKQCPACKTTYTDQSLRFCLADGATLTTLDEEQPTVISNRKEAMRVDIPNETSAPGPTDISAPINKRGSPWIKALAAVFIVGFLVVVTTAIAGMIFYYNTGGGRRSAQNSNANSSTNSPTPLPTIDPEKQRLQDELANIQKKLDEQQNSNKTANAPAFPGTQDPGVVTARVNSPNDGFLALRNEPDAEYGERIAKIPHGTLIAINNCEKSRVTIGSRTGRWCQVEYNGLTGYVFDAWLIY